MIGKNISLLQIDYFLAVAEHLSFTEAAKSLYISQPSLSKQIAVFEKEVGVQLFFRTKRSVRLTPAGTLLFKEFKVIREHMESAIEKAKKPDLGEYSTITIGCLEAMNTDTLLNNRIKAFRKKFPGVNVSIERHSFKTLREKLMNRSIDVIFTLSFELDKSMGILWDEVYKTTSTIGMASTHYLADRENITMEDLRDQNFVMISRDESPKGFDAIVGICRQHGFEPKVVKQLPNIESLLLCVESGLGIALFDSQIRIHNKENFKFFPIADDYISVVMAWKSDNLNTAIPLFLSSVLPDPEE